MTESYLLCKEEDIPATGAKGFSLETKNGHLDVFVIRKNRDFYCYINSCPHTGVTLDWLQDQFYDYSGKYIQCATHGALFRIEDGYCVNGPCITQHLTAISLQKVNDALIVLLGD